MRAAEAIIGIAVGGERAIGDTCDVFVAFILPGSDLLIRQRNILEQFVDEENRFDMTLISEVLARSKHI